jgi:hypothetical protein
MGRKRTNQRHSIIADKASAALTLASKHYDIEAGLTQIFRIVGAGEAEADPNEPIKLLEVNEATVSAGVLPLHFGALPERGIPFPSIIIEVTPAEFARIKRQQLKLPQGWAIGEELLRRGEARGTR